MKTIIFNDFFISTPYVKTLFRIKYTKANEIKPFVLKSQLMFLDVQKSKNTQKQKSLAKKIQKYQNPHKNFQNPFANLRNLNATLLF